MKRKPHILDKLKRLFGKMDCLFFDIETSTIEETEKELVQQFRLGSAKFRRFDLEGNYYGECSYELWRETDLIDIVWTHLHNRRTLNIISCNVWFDLRTSRLINMLLDDGFGVTYRYTKGVTVIIKLTLGNYKIQCLNINQFVPGSVKAYGEMLNLPKLEVDFDNIGNRELMVYCMRDTEIVAETFTKWIRFIVENNLGTFGMTLASQSFIAFRHRFMKKKLYIHADEAYTAVERKSYYGGRVEAFHIGRVPEKKIYALDINSMYPWVMKTKKIPYKITHVAHDVNRDKLYNLMQKYFCIAHVAISTDAPYFPYRTKERILFPIGKFHTVLCQPELEIAMTNNNILYSSCVLCYKQDYIFSEFVSYFHKLKQEYTESDNKTFRYISKLFLNSLYGKFGQKSDLLLMEEQIDDKKFSVCSLFHKEHNITYRDSYFGGLHTIHREGALESTHAFPAVSSAVTSYARARLLYLIIRAGWENVYYCDTDSLYVNLTGKNNLKDFIKDGKLGMLTEEKQIDEFTIHGAKDYECDGLSTIKGIPKTAIKVECNVYDTVQFPSLRRDMKEGIKKPYTIKKVGKTLERKYKKGIVSESGKVKPIDVKEW